jgi:CheY-like chemotaxis protein
VGPKKLAAFFNNVFGTRVTVEHLPNVTSLYAVLADQVSAVVDVSKVEEITTELPIEQLKTEVNVPKLEKAMFEVRVTDTTSQIPTEVSPAPNEPPRQHVLCVDDNSINLKVSTASIRSKYLLTFAKLITTTVLKLGYTCVTTMNGLEAFNAYKATTKPFTCVFMDINMPVMDGFASTRHIREYERANQLPRCQIVALTGLGSATSQQEALDCGVDMFLTKPVQMKTLRGILCHVAQPPKENG